MKRRCFSCGEPVDDDDYDIITHQYCCGEPACDRELRDMIREAEEDEVESVREKYRN